MTVSFHKVHENKEAFNLKNFILFKKFVEILNQLENVG
jgi:hypothetical protein